MDLRAPFASPILRVLFDLARDRARATAGAAEVEDVVHRVLDRLPPRGDREDLAPLVRVALRLLERADLVQFVGDDRVRLTMTGFTLAVASPQCGAKAVVSASVPAPAASAPVPVLPSEGSRRPAAGGVVAA